MIMLIYFNQDCVRSRTGILFKDCTPALYAKCRIWLPRNEIAVAVDVFMHIVVHDTESIRKRGWNVTGRQNVLRL
jgi:hypothetical protein